MNETDELIAKFRIEQSKYAYYIIALCVAAIGFSITQTMGRVLHYELWPLGLSVFLFGISIIAGLKFIKLIVGSIARDIDIKGIRLGRDEELRVILENSKKKAKWMIIWYNLQAYTFYSGIFSFVGWRIYDMYLLSLIK